MSFKKHNNETNEIHVKKKDVDYKGRLEHKLYLARENPAPIFDISNCALKNVPSGIYSLCKVFRKKQLDISYNKLSSLSAGGQLNDLSLLTFLNISHNEVTYLPGEISYLTSLEELYLQNNHIKKLPTELTNLCNLRILNIANNRLKCLPESFGNLKDLTLLDISNNSSLTQLPKSLGQANKLIDINIDGLNNMTYPPQYITEGGAITIVAFLAQECGINIDIDNTLSNNNNYNNKKKVDNVYFVDTQRKTAENYHQFLLSTDDIENNKKCNKQLIMESKMKRTFQEQRQNALLEVEKNIRKQQNYELEIQSISKGQKKKLLEDLAYEQLRLELQIERIQQEKESNRARLLTFIYNAEKEADSVIAEFLKSNEVERQQAQYELLEREKQEQQELELLLFKCHIDDDIKLSRTKETLVAMEKMILDGELLPDKKIEEYTKFRRKSNAQSLLVNTEANIDGYDQLTSSAVEKIINEHKRNRENLLDRLRKDEMLQKAALATLLERSDARSWSIVQQMKLIESQLIALTNVELERKKFEINQQINDIADKRVLLSGILVNLLEQQEKRREQLLDTINQIEKRRECDEKTRRNSLFWLMQYQSLMDARPQGLFEGLEPTLVRHVAIAGVLHCLPFLATLSNQQLADTNVVNDNQLEVLGIYNEEDRKAVLLAINNYLEEKEIYSNEKSYSKLVLPPSAPPQPSPIEEQPCSSSSSSGNTSTSYETTLNKNVTRIVNTTSECSICLDSQCEVIFLPCGHFCCCILCSNMMAESTECPMCRGCIERKIYVHKA